MANHFNELLLQTLKEISVRLDRLEERTDRVIDQKADKVDFASTNKKIDDLREDMRSQVQHLDENINSQVQRLDEDIRSQGQRLDRIEAGIGTLKWIIGVEVAVIGVILAFIRAC